jgi:L(+)-tartrate dehydratase alpha subunit
MIPIASLQKTAEQLMAKAAIEIPEDYLDGLRKCADTEKGDLSAFVIQAMLENYEAAKEDRRAMRRHGVPRWYVKIGNEAQIQGGPVALEAALPRHGQRHPRRRCGPTACTRSGARTTTTTAASAPRDRAFLPPELRLDRSHHVHRAACSAPTTACCSPATASTASKRFYLDTLIQFGRRGLSLPAGHRRRRARRLQGHLHDPGQQAACLRTVGSLQPRSQDRRARS